MDVSPTIRIDRLTKSFGTVRAVDDLSFTVSPGSVTGFLGPNGSGKTTTLRMLLGLVAPTSGRAVVGDRPYRDIKRPAQLVGAALEASSFHPGRTGLGHLRVLAPQVGVTDARCHEVLELVGLDGAKKRRAGGYSLGMRQRLGLATALLGDPSVLVLDEPANGLDPQGIVWLRDLLQAFAREGRTVLISSHVLGEVQHTVSDVVIIADGRLVHASPLDGLQALAEPRVVVVTPTPDRLAQLARLHGWPVSHDGSAQVLHGIHSAAVGAAAFAEGVELHRLDDIGASLEEVFLQLTATRSGPPPVGDGRPAPPPPPPAPTRAGGPR